jgi:acetyltransferase-like isoleucine patch superfamily enzyme
MSRVRGRRLTDRVTVWRLQGYDPSSPYTQGYSVPVQHNANYIQGGAMARDADGVEFQPNFTIRLKNVDVRLGDYVFLGKSTATSPPENAERVRAIKGAGTPLIGTRDLTVYTG